jgi:2',3'-cyclic-nucleotide 2'-phosphodiesterase (5'-nucleotidase family)
MRALAPAAADLGIAVIGGGHCHERVTDKLDGVALIESGSSLEAYVKVDIEFDTSGDTVVVMEASIHDNTGGSPNPAAATVVAYWRTRADSALSEMIGYVEATIGQYSPAMHNMVTDAWLAYFPLADISATNRGGFRADIPAGDITLATIIDVLPFENVIVELDLTGTQLINYIKAAHPVVGGMTTIGGFIRTDGTLIASDSIYVVLVTDYMYSSSDTLPVYDPEPYHTSVNWRQPVIEWIRARNTSSLTPLDVYLDTVARQQNLPW